MSNIPTSADDQSRIMATASTIRTILGIAGNGTSLLLFLSPLPTCYRIWKWKSTRQFSGIPYLAALLSCMLCAFYGTPFVHPHSILVLTINGTGSVLEAMYCTLFLIYSKNQERGKLLKILSAILIFMAAVVVLALSLGHSHQQRSLIVGLPCVAVGICMYASPLSIMRMVIRSKSVKYMPFLLSLTSFANGISWTAYACIRFDVFILIPNAMGALLGGMQLVLYSVYYSSTSWKSDDVDGETRQQECNTWHDSTGRAPLLIPKP